MRSPVYSTIFTPFLIGSRVKQPAAWIPDERTIKRIFSELLLAAMKGEMLFERGSGAMQLALHEDNQIRTSTEVGAPFTRNRVACERSFLFQLGGQCADGAAHPGQVVASHERQYTAGKMKKGGASST